MACSVRECLPVSSCQCKHSHVVTAISHAGLGDNGRGYNQQPLTSHTDLIITRRLPFAPSSVLSRLSLEDRAGHMQRREQRHILWRLLFSVVAAIPMLILGVVYMTLVSSVNPIRMWLEEPIWTGNASRGVWAMFFIATPVMFYSAGMFHRRSLREIYALWRRGSRTPVWKRFIRFGSMNLLVCLPPSRS